ncbi:Rieske 2Fe-2S domain-containing protein [Ferroplasma sp.]|uniref:Rieske (2Fe-2S) protein n=1 Tax=Ferroplasma sp. TaxID=2591003 RepID=UPI00307F77B4
MWEILFKENEIDDNSVKDVTVKGTPLLVAKSNGKIYVTDLYCTHEQTALSEGFIEGCNIVCSAHFASFNLKNGNVVSGPEGDSDPIKNLKTYNIKIENGVIMVEL